MKRIVRWRRCSSIGLSVAAAIILLGPALPNAGASGRAQASAAQEGSQRATGPAEELRVGTQLTAQGRFDEAIPHLLAARGHVPNDYAAEFNLALCYVATNRSEEAVPVLTQLLEGGHRTAGVYNLLAQAYVGAGQSQAGFDAFQHAAALTPDDEKLYAYVADACTEHRDFRLGAKVTDLGLQRIPNSARLLYQRGMFLAWLNRQDLADADLDRARQLAPDDEIGYLAGAQKYLLNGNTEEAVRLAREGVKKGHAGPLLLTVLGVALVRSGVTPGQQEFAEAQGALEKATAQRPRDASAQAALGKLYFAQGRLEDAVTHLEIARTLDPNKKEVYSQLAAAYRRQKKNQQAQSVLAVLAKLNEEEAAAIREAPAEHKGVYGATATGQKPEPQPQE